MRTLFAFIRKNPILTFALLAYLFSWWPAPFIGGSILSWGLILSAWVVLSVTEGRPGLSAWKQRLAHCRVAWTWYAAGPGIVTAYITSAFALNLLLGAALLRAPQLPALGTVLTLMLVGGQWEELGWTGYALPALQRRFAHRPQGALLAALAVGLMRALWHLPLVLAGHVAWFDMIFLSLAFQLIIAWLFNRTGGSVPAVMAMHFVSNLFGSAQPGLFAGQQFTNFYALFVAMALVIALVILWASGFKLGQAEAPGQPAVAKQPAA